MDGIYFGNYPFNILQQKVPYFNVGFTHKALDLLIALLLRNNSVCIQVYLSSAAGCFRWGIVCIVW